MRSKSEVGAERWWIRSDERLQVGSLRTIVPAWLGVTSAFQRWRSDAGEAFERQDAAARGTLWSVVDGHADVRYGPFFEFHVGVVGRSFGHDQSAQFIEVHVRTTRQKAIVADSVKAAWQYVLEKPMQEPERR